MFPLGTSQEPKGSILILSSYSIYTISLTQTFLATSFTSKTGKVHVNIISMYFKYFNPKKL